MEEIMFRAGIINYAGSKSYLVKTIEQLLPYDKKYNFLDVFGGSAVVILNKKPHEYDIYNDINKNIVNLMKQLRGHFKEFKERAKYLLACKETYDEVYQLHKNNYEGLNEIDWAIYFAYYASTSLVVASATNEYGFHYAAGNHWGRFYERIDLLYERLRRITILCEDYRVLLTKYNKPNFLVYLDPPYIDNEYGSYSQEDIDHKELADILRNARFKWLMSHWEHERIRELYKGYNYYEVDYLTFVQAHRNRYKEWLISNYDLKRFMMFGVKVL
jgi:DNA adenine methylase